MEAIACAAVPQKARTRLVHFVERDGLRARVYKAICGESVHASELELHKHAKPTCERCLAILKELDDRTTNAF